MFRDGVVFRQSYRHTNTHRDIHTECYAHCKNSTSSLSVTLLNISCSYGQYQHTAYSKVILTIKSEVELCVK